MHRRFKIGALIALCSCGLSCGSGTSSQPQIVPYTGQIITISDTTLRTGGVDTVRFGRLFEGEQAAKEVRLRNATTRPIVISGYTRSCGCTTFEFERQPIAPNAESPIRLTFDSQGLRGWQFKLIEVSIANAAAPLKIYVDTEIE
ncbi:MAG: DUF1573 domain-containing protein [Alistipes sp.]